MKKEIKEEENDEKYFEFILNRSKKILKKKEINEPIKIINYTYTREESYSDDIIFYLTQLNDKINQQKYKYFLSNLNQKSNFQVYNMNLTTDIDVFYNYEYFKNEMNNNEKAYNLHEHRKIPFEAENTHGRRRTYKNPEENKFKKINNNYNHKKSVSVDRNNYKNFRSNFLSDEDKNKDKVMVGGINEFKKEKNNYNEDNEDISMDNIYSNKNNSKKYKKRKDYCSGLTSYDPFRKKKKKKYKEDKEDDSDN